MSNSTTEFAMREAANSNRDGTRAPLDMNALEMTFGTPTAPRASKPDVHTITNEHRSPKDMLRNNNNDILKDTRTPNGTAILDPDKTAPVVKISAGPEVDDLGEKTGSPDVDDFQGIDDGLLDPADKKPDVFGFGDIEGKEDEIPVSHEDGAGGTEDGKRLFEPHDEIDFAYGDAHELESRFGVVSPAATDHPDVNTYQQKKNLAQGMMDLALLSANANQLRYVIESSAVGHPYYYFSIALISLSIVLQVGVGVGLIMNSRYNVNDKDHIGTADKINNMTVLGVFLITIVNVFISSFSVAPSSAGIMSGTTALNVQQAG